MSDSILLVEDDNADAMLIERSIRKAKIPNLIQRVDNGDAAVEFLSQVADGTLPAPLLMLLDLKLPRRSGFEVLTWLRSHDHDMRRLPVVVLTSSTQDSDVNRAYDLGANSYLVKPGDPDGLLRILEYVNAYWLLLNRGPEVATA